MEPGDPRRGGEIAVEEGGGARDVAGIGRGEGAADAPRGQGPRVR
jgi:hypothetical protein